MILHIYTIRVIFRKHMSSFDPTKKVGKRVKVVIVRTLFTESVEAVHTSCIFASRSYRNHWRFRTCENIRYLVMKLKLPCQIYLGTYWTCLPTNSVREIKTDERKRNDVVHIYCNWNGMSSITALSLSLVNQNPTTGKSVFHILT